MNYEQSSKSNYRTYASNNDNILIIISIIISAKYNPYIMIWETLIGMACEFIFQLPFAMKKGFKYKAYINIKDNYIKKMM